MLLIGTISVVFGKSGRLAPLQLFEPWTVEGGKLTMHQRCQRLNKTTIKPQHFVTQP